MLLHCKPQRNRDISPKRENVLFFFDTSLCVVKIKRERGKQAQKLLLLLRSHNTQLGDEIRSECFVVLRKREAIFTVEWPKEGRSPYGLCTKIIHKLWQFFHGKKIHTHFDCTRIEKKKLLPTRKSINNLRTFTCYDALLQFREKKISLFRLKFWGQHLLIFYISMR